MRLISYLSSTLITFIRICSGSLVDVAIGVLNFQNVRELEKLTDQSQEFRRLKVFLKNRMVIVHTGSKSYKKKIRDLVAYAGRYVFDKDGIQTTVAVGANIGFDGTLADLIDPRSITHRCINSNYVTPLSLVFKWEIGTETLSSLQSCVPFPVAKFIGRRYPMH